MGFEKLKGQDVNLKVVRSALQEGSLGHALLLDGPPGSGKRMFARLIAQALNCLETGEVPCERCSSCCRIASGHHPDLEIIEPEGQWIKIDQIRDVRKKFQFYARESGIRVCIIIDAHRFTPESTASILKILEEPPEKLMFILITSLSHRLPPTIRSRCRQFRMNRVSSEEMLSLLKERCAGYEAGDLEEAVKISAGVPGRALDLLTGCQWPETRRNVFDFGSKLLEGITEREALNEAGAWVDQNYVLPAMEALTVFFRDGLMWALSREFGVLVDPSCYFYWKDRKISPALLEECLETVITTQETLSTNANVRLILEAMFLQIQGRVQYA